MKKEEKKKAAAAGASSDKDAQKKFLPKKSGGWQNLFRLPIVARPRHKSGDVVGTFLFRPPHRVSGRWPLPRGTAGSTRINTAVTLYLYTLYTLHSTLYTLHSTLYTLPHTTYHLPPTLSPMGY